jgi:hypothetical protein
MGRELMSKEHIYTAKAKSTNQEEEMVEMEEEEMPEDT